MGDLTTVYKYKVEDEVLDKRKVRHSVDEARQMRKTCDPAKRDAIKSYLAFTMPVGELEANCFWATVSPDDYVIVIDWRPIHSLARLLPDLPSRNLHERPTLLSCRLADPTRRTL